MFVGKSNREGRVSVSWFTGQLGLGRQEPGVPSRLLPRPGTSSGAASQEYMHRKWDQIQSRAGPGHSKEACTPAVA